MRRAAWVLVLIVGCASGEDAPPTGGAGGGGAAGGASGAGPGGGGGHEPAPMASVHFSVEGADLDHEATWAPPANVVDCSGDTGLLLRFAADADPQKQPERLELQVFGYDGPGQYTGADCVGAGCPPQPPKTFALSYVPPGGGAALYRNGASSQPCALELTEPSTDVLGGTWSCESVTDVVASGEPIAVSGDFTCPH